MSQETTALHQPVMLQEAVDLLQVKQDFWYIDATFGRGGHTSAILEQGGKVLALDQDLEAICFAQHKFSLEIEQGRLKVVHSNFDQISTHANSLLSGQAEATAARGILFDFGTSLDQIRAPHRGFSFDQPDSPLDMRMNQELGVTASDLLTVLSKKQLADLFFEAGGESKASAARVAQAIDRYRKPDRSRQIKTSGELVKIVSEVKQRHSHLHPATKVFQALRIAVNSELDSIKQALPQALEILISDGRLVTIAFHQGEDSIVKDFLADWEREGKGERISHKPLKPSDQEITNNSAARSAKLRAFRKA